MKISDLTHQPFFLLCLFFFHIAARSYPGKYYHRMQIFFNTTSCKETPYAMISFSLMLGPNQIYKRKTTQLISTT